LSRPRVLLGRGKVKEEVGFDQGSRGSVEDGDLFVDVSREVMEFDL
jgi:hypothetical protein